MARMIHHGHVEAARPLRHRPADTAHTEDAERLASHAHAEQIALPNPIPPSRAHDLVVFVGAPRRRQQHHEGEVGRAFRQHVGRVGHDDTARLRRRNIDVVVADTAGGADTHACRQARDGIGTQRQRVGEHDGLGAMRMCRLDHLLGRHVAVAFGHHGIEFRTSARHHVARHQGGKHQA